MIDVNRSGGISQDELHHALQRISIQRELGWPSSRYQELFDLLDPSRTGNVTKKSLVHYMKIKSLFDTIDVSANGIISSWELESALRDKEDIRRALGVPAHLAGSLFKQMDTDGNGSITLVEFYRYYTQAALQEPYDSPQGWQQMAYRLRERIDKDRSGEISLSELASALRMDRVVQLELGWAPHKASELYEFLSRENGSQGAGITLNSLENFCRIRWLFYRIDKNRSDFIDNFEFGAALSSPGMQKELGIALSQAQRAFKEMDVERKNNVSFETFFRYFKQRPASASNDIDHTPLHQQEEKHKKPGDKYSVKRKLGQGGFGAVYLISRKSDGLELVMKKPLLESGVKMEEVQQEAEMMARLKHPHIVRLIETYEEVSNEGNALIIITEFVDGGDLRQRLKRDANGLPPHDVKRIFGQSLEALKYVHSRNVLHRDLKPDNILLTSGGASKLADLGLATQLKATQQNQAQTVCGTPVYMAPEVLDGKRYAYKADMFSMGCILYEMCTGKLCFKSPGSIVKNEIPNDIPGWCRSLVVELLSNDPNRRPDAERAMNMLAQLTPSGRGGAAPRPPPGNAAAYAPGGAYQPNFRHNQGRPYPQRL